MKRLLRRLRVSQPFNCVATSTTRAVLGALRIESDFVVRHLHRAGIVRASLPNGRELTLWSRGDDWVSNRIYWLGLDGYEPETVQIFLRYAAAARVVLDIGAFVGFYTLLAGHAAPAAAVYAFEPHPDAYGRLVRNVRLNLLTNVECLSVAAGEATGRTSLWAGSSWLPTSSSLSYRFMSSAPDLKRIDVEVVTLDDFARSRGITGVDLVKIDTESTEPDVLRGMSGILRRDRPAIVCEVLHGRGSEAALEDVLHPLGYRFWLLTPSGPVEQDRVVGHPEWLNYLFTCERP